MNVLHVSTPSSWRGGEQQVAYLVEELQAEGIRQWVLTPEGSELSRRINIAHEQICLFTKRGLLNLALAAKIVGLCRKQSIDLIHTHDSQAHSAAVVSAAVFGIRCPVVVSRRVDFPVSSNPFSRWKYNHPAVSRILCVSEEIKRITKPAIRNTSVLEVVHSGIDLERYARPVEQAFDLRRELGLDPNTPLVGNLSALADHKDYPTWIRTARRLSRLDPNMRFIIAGTGPDEQLIRDQILQAGLQDTVFLLGFRKDVERLMQSLDLFLITSKTEGLGTIVLEALAAGVPVVATRAGGIPEMIIDGETGLLAPIGDDNTLAQSVLRIFTDTALRETLVAGGRKKAATFSFRNTAAKTLQAYRAVLTE
ncbi:MAG: hypothetical protein RLZZ630_1923 [Bacteroidota bacterium]